MFADVPSLAGRTELFLLCFQMYPLWLCPFVLPNNPGMVHPKGDKPEFYVDIGAYGAPKVPNYNSLETTRRLEAFVSSAGG